MRCRKEAQTTLILHATWFCACQFNVCASRIRITYVFHIVVNVYCCLMLLPFTVSECIWVNEVYLFCVTRLFPLWHLPEFWHFRQPCYHFSLLSIRFTVKCLILLTSPYSYVSCRRISWYSSLSLSLSLSLAKQDAPQFWRFILCACARSQKCARAAF